MWRGRRMFRQFGRIENRRKIMDYKRAGVDIEAGYQSVELMK